jgi:hypothetical protein
MSSRKIDVVDGELVRTILTDTGIVTARAVLKFCTAHLEPVWVYGDGTYSCPHDDILGYPSDTHILSDFPLPKG